MACPVALLTSLQSDFERHAGLLIFHEILTLVKRGATFSEVGEPAGVVGQTGGVLPEIGIVVTGPQEVVPSRFILDQ